MKCDKPNLQENSIIIKNNKLFDFMSHIKISGTICSLTAKEIALFADVSPYLRIHCLGSACCALQHLETLKLNCTYYIQQSA